MDVKKANTSLEEDINFYSRAKELSEESIKSFIKKYNEVDKLTNYLLKTQKNKYYMLYKIGKIYLQQIGQIIMLLRLLKKIIINNGILPLQKLIKK